MGDTKQQVIKRQSFYGVIALILGLLLSSACSTTKSLERVREAPANAGTLIEVSSSLAELKQTLPGMMKELGYQDIALEPTSNQTFSLYAATPSTGASFGHAVRVNASPGNASGRVSSVALVLVRRVRLNESEDLDAARTRILSALTKRYP